MPALATVQDFVTAARRLLQDTVGPPTQAYRYPDAELIDAMNLAFLEARKIRPDLFLKVKFVAPSFTTANLNTAVVFNDMYRHAIVYFMTGYMQLRDDESTTDSRAAALIGKFSGQLLTMT